MHTLLYADVGYHAWHITTQRTRRTIAIHTWYARSKLRKLAEIGTCGNFDVQKNILLHFSLGQSEPWIRLLPDWEPAFTALARLRPTHYMMIRQTHFRLIAPVLWTSTLVALSGAQGCRPDRPNGADVVGSWGVGVEVFLRTTPPTVIEQLSTKTLTINLIRFNQKKKVDYEIMVNQIT